MDEQRQVDEQVEDLDVSAGDAEEVKGGFSFGVEREYKAGMSIEKIEPQNLRGGPSGIDHQHNEIVVRI